MSDSGSAAPALDDVEVLDLDLGFDLRIAKNWFCSDEESSYLLVHVRDEQAETLADEIAVPLRRCYADDRLLKDRSAATGAAQIEILRAKLPDRGAVMSGDFGEILVFLFESTRHLPTIAIGPKKWRLKQDRMKAAPGSDLIHFVLPKWPNASDQDAVVCTEVKAKATAGGNSPVPDAIRGCQEGPHQQVGQDAGLVGGASPRGGSWGSHERAHPAVHRTRPAP